VQKDLEPCFSGEEVQIDDNADSDTILCFFPLLLCMRLRIDKYDSYIKKMNWNCRPYQLLLCYAPI